MKINNEQSQQIMQAYGLKQVGKASKAEAPGTVQRSDDAALSATGQEISKAMALISKTPDVRLDRVEALKAQFAAGTYQVSGKDVAEAILRREYGA